MITDEMVEDGCRGMYGPTWDGPVEKMPGEEMKNVWRKMSRAALTAALQGSVVVPREPTEEMWGGLARAIIMWTRFARPSQSALLRHLQSSGETIPEWLSKECGNTDHVPPKGSVAVWIYKAMLDAAPSHTRHDGEATK